MYAWSADPDPLRPRDALSYEEWMEMVEGLDLIGSSFSQRDAVFCFLWSRMWCIDDGSLHARLKMANLVSHAFLQDTQSSAPWHVETELSCACACASWQWFEDFLECVVRASLMMSLPTDDEVADSGFEDAGEMILTFKATDELDAFVATRPADWRQPRQPAARAVEHFLTLAIRTIQIHVKAEAGVQLSHKVIHEFREASAPPAF